MEEELEGKGTLLTFPRIPMSSETASAPSTFVNVCVRMCAFPWLCAQYQLFHSVKHRLSTEQHAAHTIVHSQIGVKRC